MAGGWAEAARIPAVEALAMATDHLRERRWSSHAQALQCWCTMASAVAMGGGSPQDPPPPPED